MDDLKGFSSTGPGYALAVVRKDQIILKQCLGLANMEKNIPISSSTAFRLASLTKPFTAMCIMILKQKGCLSFEDTLVTFFPDFPAYGRKITVRQLLTHLSGIPDHETVLYKQLKPSKEPTIYDSLNILKKAKKILFPAGSKFEYSNSGYVLLALIIEKVSGQKYSKFLTENVFNPLNLKNTTVLDETKPEIKNRALGYQKTKNGYVLFDYDPLNYIVGDEGIYSTINDLIIWKDAWSKDILISKKNLREALTPGVLSNGNFGECGFSWFIGQRGIISHTGSWVGFNNVMLTNLRSDTTVILLSNSTLLSGEEKKLTLAQNILKEVSYRMINSS